MSLMETKLVWWLRSHITVERVPCAREGGGGGAHSGRHAIVYPAHCQAEHSEVNAIRFDVLRPYRRYELKKCYKGCGMCTPKSTVRG